MVGVTDTLLVVGMFNTGQSKVALPQFGSFPLSVIVPHLLSKTALAASPLQY